MNRMTLNGTMMHKVHAERSENVFIELVQIDARRGQTTR